MDTYDIVIIGAGSGGLVAAQFAQQLGVQVALVEKSRIGGDCTWTGCVPSKALVRVAKVAHMARSAASYGVLTGEPRVDMPGVRRYLDHAIQDIYRHETPEQIRSEGKDVYFGAARFRDPHTVLAGDAVLSARNFIVATGARPTIPPLDGLETVTYHTYETIFELDQLPGRLLVLGAGPLGFEFAQAYQRLGSQVVLIGEQMLPNDDPDAVQVISNVLRAEGVRLVTGVATAVRQTGSEIVLTVDDEEIRGDTLLVSVGRSPVVEGMALERAGVEYTAEGITVNRSLQTTAPHVYAIGDCTGGYQYTHFAGWQGFQAVRNALLPGSSSGFPSAVPWTTFTDPEVAQVGLTEPQAHKRYNGDIDVTCIEMARTDRAITDNATDGFIKLVHRHDGTLLGATVVAERAGEVINEFAIAIQTNMRMIDLAGVIHTYPTYGTAAQLVASQVATNVFLGGFTGRFARLMAEFRW